MALLLAMAAQGAWSAEKAPWWKQQKIVFMWGQWAHARVDKSGNWWLADLPPDLFRNVALAGATVFVECRGYKPDHASRA